LVVTVDILRHIRYVRLRRGADTVSLDETPLWMVDDPETLARMAARLLSARVVAIDTESDSFHHYQEKVCLIQFSDLDTDYILDPLAVPDISILAPLFADPQIVKVFHGADYDIVSLKRDFGFEIHNLFDTMISSQQLGLPGVGLADLIREFFGIEIDKKYQRHDWAERPLLFDHIEYARGDTHYLLAIREILLRRLERRGRLARVLEECARLEKREWEGRSFDPDGYLRVKGSIALDDPGKRVLRRLWLLRDQDARRLDRPPFKVIPDPVLVDLARVRPRSEGELDRLFAGGKQGLRRKFGSQFLDAIKLGLQDDFPIPKPKAKRPGGPSRLSGKIAEKAMNALKDWRNDVVDANPGTQAVAVISNASLKNLVRSRPKDLEELALVPDVRAWQVEAYGAQLLAVLDSVAPWSDEVVVEEEVEDNGPKRRRRRRRR
jgi:ribonuclease D